MEDLVTVITTTHIIPTAPSTEIIESTITSFYKNFKDASTLRHLIYIDSNPSNENNDKYISNVYKLKEKWPNIEVYDRPNSGLKANYLEGINISTTPFLFFLEHDWVFTEQVPLRSLIDIFINNSNVNYVRFMMDKDKIQCNSNIYITYLIESKEWVNHPHISRREKWLQDWINVVNPNVKSVESYGIEMELGIRYFYDLEISKKSMSWGCYSYITPCIEHTDGSQHYDGKHPISVNTQKRVDSLNKIWRSILCPNLE